MNIAGSLILGQSKIGLLAYVYDTAIIEDDMQIGKKHFKKLINAASKVDLIINDEKMEYMKLSRMDSVYQLGESMGKTPSTEYHNLNYYFFFLNLF